MAALVSLAVAKSHLGVEQDQVYWDADIDLKAEQASDMILGYLKGRRVVVSTITSAGAVATVTTSGAHGLTSDDLVDLFGAAEPEYNGQFVATVASTTVFTIPITGSPATPATGTIRLSVPYTWTDETVPPRVQSAVLMLLTHLWANRGDVDMSLDEAVWAAVGRILVRDRDPVVA